MYQVWVLGSVRVQEDSYVSLDLKEIHDFTFPVCITFSLTFTRIIYPQCFINLDFLIVDF